jgi:flagellar motor switch protein FliN/FliY
MSDVPPENAGAEETPAGAPKPEKKSQPEPARAEAAVDQEPPETSSVRNEELAKPDKPGSARPLDLDFILDIPLNVTVEVGRTKLLIQELLQLGQGSVIELDKLMGEPFEVLVNEKLVARGEIVVVNDRFGVRLTDIVSPSERVQSLA